MSRGEYWGNAGFGGSLLLDYTGKQTVAVDGKGRIAIPAKYRAIAAAQGSDKFFVTFNVDGCLDLYSDAEFRKFTEKLAPESAMDSKQERHLKRFLYSNSAEGIPDSQGRITIPKHLLDYAGIDKQVLILGVRERIELWNEQRYKAYDQSFPMTVEEVVENLFGKRK